MKKTFITAIIMVLVFVFSELSFAGGGGPSEEKCEDLGLIDITCIICNTGQKIGMISIEAAYDPSYGDCMLYYREARRKCASTYGKSKSVTGIKWEYWMGATKYYGHYPTSCLTSQKSYVPGPLGSSTAPITDDSKFSGKQ